MHREIGGAAALAPFEAACSAAQACMCYSSSAPGAAAVLKPGKADSLLRGSKARTLSAAGRGLAVSRPMAQRSEAEERGAEG